MSLNFKDIYLKIKKKKTKKNILNNRKWKIFDTIKSNLSKVSANMK